MAWQPFLRVWSLARPVAGDSEVTIAVSSSSGLFLTEFGTDITHAYGDLISVQTRTTSGMSKVVPKLENSFPEIGEVGAPKRRPYSITVTDIVSFQFTLTHPALGQVAGGPASFAGRVLPQRRAGVLPDAGRGPYLNDVDTNKIRSFGRLAQTADWHASFVRVELDNAPEASAPWWLQFRFPFRVPALGDQGGMGSPAESGWLNADHLFGVANLDNALSAIDQRQFRLIHAAAAEEREAGLRRISYIAGGLRKSPDNLLESFAINAAGLSAIHPIASERRGDNQQILDDKLTPTKKDRWGRASRLDDGFWWAKNQVDNDGGDLSSQQNLKLAEVLAWLGAFPDQSGSNSKRPIVAVASTQPLGAANIEPSVGLLKALGLQTAQAVVEPYNSQKLPLHHLHTRLVRTTNAADVGRLEWLRWINLASPQPAASVDAVPVLLRVRQGGSNGNGTPTLDDVTSHYMVTIEGLTDAHVLTLWSRHVAEPLRAAARAATGRGALSLVPDLIGAPPSSEDKAKGGLWTLKLECSEAVTAIILSGGQMQPPLPNDFIKKIELFRAVKRPGEDANWYPLETADAATGPVTLRATKFDFAHILAHGGEPVSVAADKVVVPSTLTFGFGPTWRLNTARHRLTLKPAAIESMHDVALSGLDLSITRMIDDCDIDVTVEGTALDYVIKDRPLQFKLNKVVVGGAPLGQAGETSLADQPLIWSAEPLTEAAVLEGRDDNPGDGKGRRTTFDLRPDAGPLTNQAAGADQPFADVTVVGSSPMIVARVLAPRLTKPTETQSSAATWDSRELVWRLVWNSDNRAPTATFILPPQAVAEDWERSNGSNGAWLPQDHVAPDLRVPARLTPAARFEIETEERARNPVAPWDIKRLFADLAADLPGARLRTIERFETLYGLEAYGSATEGFRVAELAGWRGEPRNPLRSHVTEADRFMLWEAAIRVWRGRLGVLDVRAEVDPLVRPIISDVNYRLRPLGTGPGDGHYAWPARGQPSVQPPAGWGAWQPNGMLGGALAGFEQHNMIEALLRGAANGNGTIDGLMLSALGAWTRQRAGFNNGLTLISCDIQMGRVHEARFERKGRIGALGTLAKHVIVYRRSFVPPEQFAAEQDEHLGRPIIRKSEEYIEIEQPLRRYPDRLGAGEKPGGPVIGARFRTVRIPVFGSWAEEIDDPRFEGYSIPLYKPGAMAEVAPALDKRPVVELLLAGDPARSEPEPLARRIENPEDLRFYTVTSVITGTGKIEPLADVEAWRYVYGLDQISRPFDDPLDAKIEKDDFAAQDNPGAPLPPADAVAPGLERFTLRLESGAPVNIGQGRFAKPMLADLRTVTIMRGVRAKRPEKPSPDVAAYQQLRRAPAEIVKFAALVSDGSDVAALKVKAATALRDIVDNHFPSTSLIAATPLCNWLQAADPKLDYFHSRLGQLSKSLPSESEWKAKRDELVAPLVEADARLAAWSPVLPAIMRLLSGPLDDARGLQIRMIGEITAVELRVLDALTDAKMTLDALDLTALRDLAARIETATTVGTLANEVRRALGVVTDAGRRVSAVAPVVETRALEIDTAVRAQLDRLIKVVPKIAPEIREVAANIVGYGQSAGSAMRKLSKELDNADAEARELVSRWEEQAKGSQAALATRLNSAHADLTGKLLALRKTIEDLATKEVSGAAETIRRKLTPEDPVNDPLKILENNITAAIEPLVPTELNAAITAAREALATIYKAATEETAYPATTIIALRSSLDDAQTRVAALRTALATAVDNFCKTDLLKDTIVAKLLERADGAVHAIIASFDPNLDKFRKQIADITLALETTAQQIQSAIAAKIDKQVVAALKAALDTPINPESLIEDTALNLLRAAGAPPIVEQLVFNRERIAYFFDQELNRLVTTPVTALVDQVGSELRGIGITQAMLGIDTELLSPIHDAFNDVRDDLKSIEFKAKEVLKDFAGLKDLLPRMKFDNALSRAIKITQDVDVKKRTAWLQADINHGPVTEPLFTYDAFEVVAERLMLTGSARYERALSGGETKRVTAQLKSDWVMVLGGTRLVQIKDAIASYDDRSGLSFDIKPENIEFAGAIQMFTKVLEKFNGGDPPMSIEMVIADGRPVGLRSRYDMPPTTFTAGAITLLNASLGVHLELTQKSEFEIRVFAYFGLAKSPFSLIVGILGGGGYLEAEAIHRPASNSTEIAVSLSVGACAGAGFSFGPLRGYVQFYLGMRASYRSGIGGTRLSISAIIVISGSVTAWGFVTVDLGMVLTITYDGAKVIGQGSVHVEVRISRFFKKKFSRSIAHKL
jgi:hypothetical protein